MYKNQQNQLFKKILGRWNISFCITEVHGSTVHRFVSIIWIDCSFESLLKGDVSGGIKRERLEGRPPSHSDPKKINFMRKGWILRGKGGLPHKENFSKKFSAIPPTITEFWICHWTAYFRFWPERTDHPNLVFTRIFYWENLAIF